MSTESTRSPDLEASLAALDVTPTGDDAQFSNPVLSMGICGVELHAHTWELGPRKARELLLTPVVRSLPSRPSSSEW